jgi:hypothetical protein
MNTRISKLSGVQLRDVGAKSREGKAEGREQRAESRGMQAHREQIEEVLRELLTA